MIWGRRGRELKKKKEAYCSPLWYSLWPSTVDILASCITSCYFSAVVQLRGGTSAEIISSLCQKAKRWIGYLRKGISPLCTLWIIHCNMHGCHTLVLLTFLYLTVKNSLFSHLFSALVFAITMFQSCLVPTVTRNTQKDRQSFFWCSNYRPYLFETKSLV